MSDHSKYIKRCFVLAKKGKGLVAPNPLVGAVIVKNSKVIGEGFHKKHGSAHAEVNAIKKAGKNVIGSTLYCNLEPCCHTNKQTPPCVPLIIEKKIKRVVISNLDPNKEVNGKGVKQLKESGIEVTTGILEDEGKELNKFYFKYAKEKLPYVTVKVAQSTDGKISISKKEQTWLTGKQSIKYVHKLRSEYDAVLVGAGTIKTDNPQLTVREAKDRNPIRVIIDGKLSIPISSKVIECPDPQNTFIFTSKTVSERKAKQLSKKGVRIFRLRTSAKNQISIKSILKVVAKQKITSVLVEGGSEIFNQFVDKNLFDEIIILQSPKILRRGISAFNPKKLRGIQLSSTEKIGKDIKFIYRKNLS
ncbi:MAG: bifunctional diaminohydroxyphosphoribosylaminopyrimidine deaminase/5-amino-6-(5-phosphoribosylamino)uracil reductase RibD, partial [Chlorobium sp.]|nr:bifunctional diaminohydroxyphosphoribosylaminopyrimidine deaminase/5-amino-6-(5-phosphoribosylamino)uracil reductase RibD [Chlorobium sp.]